MFYRILAVAIIACLLAGCSGGETTADSVPPARSDSTVADENQMDQAATSEGTNLSPEDTARGQDVTPEGAQDEAPVVAEEGNLSSINRAQTGTATPSSPGSETAEPEAVDGPAPGNVAASASSSLRVVRAYVCKGIEQGEPAEAGKSFIPEDGVIRLCCFSEISGAAGPDTVFHVWRWGEREMARVALEVKSSRWRTWSTKRILDEWRGEWRVDVTDSSGAVLASLEFSVE